jgi:glycine hydroxymethyltransferase
MIKDKEVLSLIEQERERENKTINLIASENYSSLDVRNAEASFFINKYAEGYPGKRYYSGCIYTDKIENLAIERCKNLFNVKYVNVQPHSGSQANMAAYFSLIKPKDKILSLSLDNGGHLTHGSPVNFSGQLFNFDHYSLTKDGFLDYDQILSIAKKFKPKVIVAGYSAYSRTIDFKKFREIADIVGAFLLSDISHISGLIASNVHPDPFKYSHIVTSTTHKTLRGPRGAVIMTNDSDIFENIQKSVFPGVQGGPLENVIAAKAIAFGEDLKDSFKSYSRDIIANSKYLVEALQVRGFNIVSGGSDNHLFVVDLRNFDITGKEAQDLLELCNINVSKSLIPYDKNKPWIASGIRLGTPAITSRGLKTREVEKVADFIEQIIKTRKKIDIKKISTEVEDFITKFPIPDHYV